MLRPIKQGTSVYRLSVTIEEVENLESWRGEEVFKEKLSVRSLTEALGFLDLVKQLIQERFEDAPCTLGEVERLIQFEGSTHASQ